MTKEKDFEKDLKVTKETEDQQKTAADSQKLKEILEGEQTVYIKGYGDIVFEYPKAGLVIEAERLEAEFKATSLRNSTFLTEAQLKAIYGKPVTIEVDGKEVEVGSGEWSETNDRLMEELPEQIKDLEEMFDIGREAYQEFDRDLLKATKKADKKTFEQKKKLKFEETFNIRQESLEKQKELLELQMKRLQLFSASLEERAFFEKIKLYLPSSVFKMNGNGDKATKEFLWKNYEEFENSEFLASRVISLYSLFIRGADISFFGDVREEEISS